MAERPPVRRVLAPNPGPMTLDGTNTWVLGDPAAGPPLVVDPGPLDEAHLARVLQACGGRATAVLLTHRHHDHADAASALAERAGCGVRAADPSLVVGGEGLAEDDRLTAAGVALRVLVTPGHTSDSVCLLLDGGDGPPLLLTGDTVLGRGTTVIAEPDGDLGAYLDSLHRLVAVVEDAGVDRLLPGHGPEVEQPLPWLRHYLAHREERLDQVRTARTAGARTAEQVVDVVYGDLDPALQRAALQSVRAQLRFLGEGLDPS